MDLEEIKKRPGYVVHRESRTNKHVIAKGRNKYECRVCCMKIKKGDLHVSQIKNGAPKYRWHYSCYKF